MQFQMKELGDAQYVLGIQIVRNRKNKTLAMSQASYIDKMLSRYKMQNSKKGLLPYRYEIHLSKEQCPKTPHLHLMEFAYNNSFHTTIGMTPFEALYGKCCRSSVCWDEVGEQRLMGPELVQSTNEAI